MGDTMEKIVGFLKLALQIVPLVVQVGGKLPEYIEWVMGVVNSDTGPTDADWDALHSREAELRAKLNNPAS